MNSPQLTSLPTRPAVANAGAVVTVLALVAAALAALGFVQVVYITAFVQTAGAMASVFGITISVFAGAIAVVLAGIGAFFASTRRLALTALAIGVAAPVLTLALSAFA